MGEAGVARVAIVTAAGSTGGLGKAIAAALARAGHIAVVNDLDEDAAHETAEQDRRRGASGAGNRCRRLRCRRRAADGRRGRTALRPHRHPGQLRRNSKQDFDCRYQGRRDRSRAGRESQVGDSLHQRGGPDHEATTVRADREHRLDRWPARRRRIHDFHVALCGNQGRHRRLLALGGAGAGPFWHYRQRRRAVSDRRSGKVPRPRRRRWWRRCCATSRCAASARRRTWRRAFFFLRRRVPDTSPAWNST